MTLRWILDNIISTNCISELVLSLVRSVSITLHCPWHHFLRIYLAYYTIHCSFGTGSASLFNVQLPHTRLRNIENTSQFFQNWSQGPDFDFLHITLTHALFFDPCTFSYVSGCEFSSSHPKNLPCKAVARNITPSSSNSHEDFRQTSMALFTTLVT